MHLSVDHEGQQLAPETWKIICSHDFRLCFGLCWVRPSAILVTNHLLENGKEVGTIETSKKFQTITNTHQLCAVGKWDGMGSNTTYRSMDILTFAFSMWLNNKGMMIWRHTQSLKTVCVQFQSMPTFIFSRRKERNQHQPPLHQPPLLPNQDAASIGPCATHMLKALYQSIHLGKQQRNQRESAWPGYSFYTFWRSEA